jgi:hypothetical protein
VAAHKLLAKPWLMRKGKIQAAWGAVAQVCEDGGARTRSGGVPFPIPFLPMSCRFLFFAGSRRRWTPLVSPHTPLPRRGSSGFGRRACDASLPNRLAAKSSPLHIQLHPPRVIIMTLWSSLPSLIWCHVIKKFIWQSINC